MGSVGAEVGNEAAGEAETAGGMVAGGRRRDLFRIRGIRYWRPSIGGLDGPPLQAARETVTRAKVRMAATRECVGNVDIRNIQRRELLSVECLCMLAS